MRKSEIFQQEHQQKSGKQRICKRIQIDGFTEQIFQCKYKLHFPSTLQPECENGTPTWAGGSTPKNSYFNMNVSISQQSYRVKYTLLISTSSYSENWQHFSTEPTKIVRPDLKLVLFFFNIYFFLENVGLKCSHNTYLLHNIYDQSLHNSD